jgi:DNA-binding NtrC family response regulator
MIETMGKSGQILVADNDEIIVSTISDLLEDEGFVCTPIHSSSEGIRTLEVNHYDLLITEPQMRGNEELELIQAAHRYAPGMPAIIYTAHPTLCTAVASIQLPVTAYLVKPVESSLLLQHVKMSIADYRAYKKREALLQRSAVYAWAIEETIQILAATRSSFNSRRLSGLRRKLEKILASGQIE